jgi:hypothetical protein
MDTMKGEADKSLKPWWLMVIELIEVAARNTGHHFAAISSTGQNHGSKLDKAIPVRRHVYHGKFWFFPGQDHKQMKNLLERRVYIVSIESSPGSVAGLIAGVKVQQPEALLEG